MPDLTLCLMMKNEEHQIEKTIQSCLPHVTSMIFLDTGSTDNTISFVELLTKNIPHEIYQEEFVDFATSKNKLLELARNSSIAKNYLLLLDSNDVLETKIPHLILDSYYTTFQCVSKTNIVNTTKRMSIIKKSKPFYFKYPVHEILVCDEEFSSEELNITISHNRSHDKSSIERYHRDIELLSKHSSDPRCMFYLGQTYYHLKDYRLSYHWYNERKNIPPPNEEQYLAYLYSFKILTTYFIKSSELIEKIKIPELEKFNTCEVMFLIGVYYFNTNQFEKAHSYAKKACEFEYLPNVFEPSVYTTDRWQLLELSKNKIENTISE